MNHGQGTPKGGCNAIHSHQSITGGSSLPPFSGSGSISSSYSGGVTGLWDLTLLLQDSGGAPLTSSAVVNFTFRDDTNGTTIATASYNVGDIIGTDAPIMESGWVANVVPYLTGVAVTDAAVIGFTLYDYLLADPDDLFSNLVRTFQFCITVEDGGLPSAQDCADVDYSFFKVEYETQKSGLHTTKIRQDIVGWSLIDWGDTSTAALSISTATTDLQTTYADATAKTVRMALQTFADILEFQQFSQEVNSIEEFETGSCTKFRLDAGNITSLPAGYDFSSLTYFDINAQDITTLSAGYDFSNVVTLVLKYNPLTSLPAAWDVSSVEYFNCQYCSLATLPAWADVLAMEELHARNNAITSLPSWTFGAIEIIDLTSNPLLTAIPASWLPATPLKLKLSATGLSSIPAFDFSMCNEFRIELTGLTTIEGTHDFTQMVTFKAELCSLTAWNQTAIGLLATTITLYNNSLSESEVDDILAQARTSYDASNRAISLRIEGNTAPSATGAADKAYLNGLGCTIITD